MRKIIGVSLALMCAGCGTWLVQGDLDVRTGAHATVEVGARGSRRVGGLEIVEQAPGQGFIVEGGARVLAALDGFEAAADGSGGMASVASDAPQTGFAADGSRSGGTNASFAGAPSSTATVSSNGSGSGSGTSVSYAGAPSGNASVSSNGSGSGTSVSGAPSGHSNVSSSGSGSATVEIEARASVPRDGVWGREGRATAITALDGAGVQVDGVVVSLAELESLARVHIEAAPSLRLPTDGALEVVTQLEHETLARAGGETHVVVRLRAPEAEHPTRERLRVHLVIDRSSSMQRDWPRVLEAARILIRRLSADDEIHIVGYGSDAFEAYAVARVGDGRAAIRALEAINVGGGTNIEAGLDLAYAGAARPGPRSLVILLSDGVPNSGAFEASELGSLAAAARRRGCTTSVIGLGTGFDAAVLRAIARQGSGGYHVSASLDALAAGLVAELEAHARSSALNVAVRVELPSDVTLLGIAEGEAENVGGAVMLSVPHFDAGEERRIVLRVRVPAGSRARAIARVELDYRSSLSGRTISAARDLEVSYGPRAIASGGAAGIGVLDASLAAALDAAGTAIANGSTAQATSALEAHAALIEGRVEHTRSEPIRARARVVRRIATAVQALLPGATHPQRRQAALSFGALAARIGR